MTGPGELISLRDYQQEALDAINASWKRGVRRPTAVLAMGLGKGHPLDTEVPTPDGLRLWGDLAVGDQVFGSDGAPTAVTAIYDRGVLDTYRVTLKHGESVVVDGDHLWQVQRRGRKPRVVSTAWLAEQPLKGNEGYLWAIPVTGAVQRAEADLPLDPYVVGSLIANGGMTHAGTVLTTPDRQVIERVRRHVIANELGVYPGRTCPAFGLPGLTAVTRSLGMRVHSRDKRIPRAYLESSVSQRVALLQGLMVADGSVRHGGRRCVNYSTTSVGLAEDVSELVTSLGGTCSINKYDRTHVDKGVEYILSILLPTDVLAFDTDRKVADSAPRRTFHPRSAIVSIEPAGRTQIRCITVAASDHLYLITRNHIVTHNTIIFAHLVKEFLAENLSKRVLVLAHTDELVTQAAQKVKIVAPHLPVGIVQGTRNDVWAPVVIVSVASLRTEMRRNQLVDVGLIIVDECHHATAKTYVDILTHFGAFEPTERTINDDLMDYGALGRDRTPVRVVGFTATLARSDGAQLNKVWDEVAFERDILFGITHNDNGPCEPGYGYLLDIEGISVEVPDLDLDAVKKSRGDFQNGDLGVAMTESLAPELVADAYLEHAKDRAGLAFWPTVDAAYIGAEAMNAKGIVTEVVHGGLKQEDRRLILKRFMVGDTQVVSNCMVLTEGFDAPWADVAVLARPTRSKPLFQQIVGRVLRPYPGQLKALLLDVCGAGAHNDLRSLSDLSDKDIAIREGQSLAEAVAEKEAADSAPIVVPYKGPVVFAEFDPLARKSKRVWMETRGGVKFLAWGARRYLFLVPATPRQDPFEGEILPNPGTWDVAWCTKDNTGWLMPDRTVRLGGFTEHRGIDLSFAMKWTETMVDQLGDDVADFGRKSAAWRKRPASEKQLNYARTLGCRVADTMTGDEVSLAIDTAIASPRIDYYVSKIMGG